MRNILAMAVVVLISMAAVPAQARYETGNTLYSDCTNSGTKIDRLVAGAHCSSYIVGVYDEHEFQSLISKTSPEFCAPKGVVIQQLVDIVTKFLVDNPESRQYPAAALVKLSLTKAFPCKDVIK